jgi:3-isopropylmalate/(R)-2-methylmalate dehydratase small subunit
MQPFIQHTGLVVPLDRANVDTDAIIPKQFLKSIKRSGFGGHLFDEWRYRDPGELGQHNSQRVLNPDFPLNQSRYQGASVLLTRSNFGCGSSREHAVWALRDYGLRCVIGPSFADIFFNNCFKNGLLPLCLATDVVDKLFCEEAESESGYRLHIDLPAQTITTPHREAIHFEIEDFRKERLLKGLDDIGLTLQHTADIRAYEARRRREAPWLFMDGLNVQ